MKKKNVRNGLFRKSAHRARVDGYKKWDDTSTVSVSHEGIWVGSRVDAQTERVWGTVRELTRKLRSRWFRRDQKPADWSVESIK